MDARRNDSAAKNILIAEHDQESGEKLMAALKTYNFTGDLVHDGQTVLEKLNTGVYDAILLNLVLPTITGIDVLTTIRKPESKHKKLAVFVMTNFDHRHLIEAAFTIGADRFFLKSQLSSDAMIAEIANFFAQLPKT
ncbi:TPA: hypothetical protein DIV55_03840 [Patescibacteria group bacterium]|uniref:DNA-binding response regulator n=1 Tax=Candidatus Gottesmanbacteria bacterium GW2011_GWA1_43_11 TaxID=1618436 RepID=A0A0G1CI45_9BACT|nr:MAG: DNA-binding response regulator [Candidatus Gottesmanbacteria bacterium GW2011_GWA1_43_11]HCS78851.1 hypothetical protein [Patescibacteria group bacterium]